MSDNAADMSGQVGGLSTLIKNQNKSIYDSTYICHSINLVIKNTMKWLKQDEHYIEPEVIEVKDFLNSITSLFHYSYKKEHQYKEFRQNFLDKKRKENEYLYPEIKEFPKLVTYNEIRFLSLGNSLDFILIQWNCLMNFYNL